MRTPPRKFFTPRPVCSRAASRGAEARARPPAGTGACRPGTDNSRHRPPSRRPLGSPLPQPQRPRSGAPPARRAAQRGAGRGLPVTRAQTPAGAARKPGRPWRPRERRCLPRCSRGRRRRLAASPPPWEQSRVARPRAALASPAPQVGARRPGTWDGRGPCVGGRQGDGSGAPGRPWRGGGGSGSGVPWRRPAAGAGAAGAGEAVAAEKGRVLLGEAAAGGAQPFPSAPGPLGGRWGHQPGKGRQGRRGVCTPEPRRGPTSCCRDEGAGCGARGRVVRECQWCRCFKISRYVIVKKLCLNVIRSQGKG